MSRKTCVLLVASMASAIALLSLANCGAKAPDNDDTTPKPYTCAGTPATCLRLGSGWTYEGVILTMSPNRERWPGSFRDPPG